MTTKLEQAAREVIRQHSMECLSDKAVDSLREALAEQAEQEPIENNDWKKASYIRETLNAEQAKQEPVAWGRMFDGDIIDCICPEEHALNEGDYTISLYATPVRTKDLTDDEILKCDERSHGNTEWTKKKAFARAVIAADRKLNKQTKENQE